MYVRRHLAPLAIALALSLGALGFAPSAGALTVIDKNFDQVAKIVSLGGTATQIGGTSPGKNLTVAGDFDGTPDSQSGVSVSMPAYTFVQSVDNFNDGGSAEPGNTPAMLLGSPTDITFTTPGSGGPDGGPGDGSVQILDSGAGGTITVSFGANQLAPIGSIADLFIFTNTAAGYSGSTQHGQATIELLDNSFAVIAGQSVVDDIWMGMVGSGMGGMILDIPDGTVFYAVRITPSSAMGVEIDAVAVIPEPSTALLFGGGLLALALRSRRRT